VSTPSYSWRFWSGLLASEHREAIGIALWEFLWCIDRTTEEEGGIGKVLGGKEVTATEIGEELGVSSRTCRTNLNRLDDHGYIRLIKGRYGFRIEVPKSKKWPFPGRKKASGLEPPQVGRDLPTSRKKPSALHNKDDKAVDCTESDDDHHADSAPPEQLPEDHPNYGGPLPLNPDAAPYPQAVSSETSALAAQIESDLRMNPTVTGVHLRHLETAREHLADARILKLVASKASSIQAAHNPWSYIVGLQKQGGILFNEIEHPSTDRGEGRVDDEGFLRPSGRTAEDRGFHVHDS
jgi:DNA-binding Lrp family transcriptional regulator